MDVALSTLLSPIILFFALGMVAALLRSQMSVPEAIAKGMAIYLMMAIGLKGGVEMSKNPLTVEVLLVLLAGIVLSFLIPVIAFILLRISTKLDRIDAAATAAHYGSISIVTFVAATEAVRLSGLDSGGHLVAVAALMETPAIITALFLASRGPGRSATPVAGSEQGELVREVFLNASIVVLVGALAIGWIAGEEGTQTVQPFFVDLFQGVLCLFLLDMGLIAARRIMDARAVTWRLTAIAIFLPIVNGAVGTTLGVMIGLPAGSAAALGVLCASASYIAVPAAMRLALPEADPGIYLTMSLSVTFPFNVLVNIALISALSVYLTGA